MNVLLLICVRRNAIIISLTTFRTNRWRGVLTIESFVVINERLEPIGLTQPSMIGASIYCHIGTLGQSSSLPQH